MSAGIRKSALPVAEFVGTCVSLKAEDLEAYDETEREITYRTFIRRVGTEVVASFGSHPPLKRDWHVHYGKGKWRGRPAVCLHHSRIHYIWIIA